MNTHNRAFLSQSQAGAPFGVWRLAVHSLFLATCVGVSASAAAAQGGPITPGTSHGDGYPKFSDKKPKLGDEMVTGKKTFWNFINEEPYYWLQFDKKARVVIHGEGASLYGWGYAWSDDSDELAKVKGEAATADEVIFAIEGADFQPYQFWAENDIQFSAIWEVPGGKNNRVLGELKAMDIAGGRHSFKLVVNKSASTTVKTGYTAKVTGNLGVNGELSSSTEGGKVTDGEKLEGGAGVGFEFGVSGESTDTVPAGVTDLFTSKVIEVEDSKIGYCPDTYTARHSSTGYLDIKAQPTNPWGPADGETRVEVSEFDCQNRVFGTYMLYQGPVPPPATSPPPRPGDGWTHIHIPDDSGKTPIPGPTTTFGGVPKNPVGLALEVGALPALITLCMDEILEEDAVFTLTPAIQDSLVFTDLTSDEGGQTFELRIPAGQTCASTAFFPLIAGELGIDVQAQGDFFAPPPSATVPFLAASLSTRPEPLITMSVSDHDESKSDSVHIVDGQRFLLHVDRSVYQNVSTEKATFALSYNDPAGILVAPPAILEIPAGAHTAVALINTASVTGEVDVTTTLIGTHLTDISTIFVSQQQLELVPKQLLFQGAAAQLSVTLPHAAFANTNVSVTSNNQAVVLPTQPAMQVDKLNSGDRSWIVATGVGTTDISVSTPNGEALSATSSVTVVPCPYNFSPNSITIAGIEANRGGSVHFQLPSGISFTSFEADAYASDGLSVEIQDAGNAKISIAEGHTLPSAVQINVGYSEANTTIGVTDIYHDYGVAATNTNWFRAN